MDDVVLVPYDAQWPDVFAQEAARVRHLLGDLVTRVEHIGSTAVPGLHAKPIIDLLVGVRSLDQAKQQAVPVLEAVGYSYWRDNPEQERMFLVKGLPPNGPRTHHLHMVEPASMVWERVLFRDYLRSHPSEAQRYAQLKHELAAQFPHDREAYTDGKTMYIAAVLAKACAAML
jgi:GrpB-like predicted nucleotidyltransferase (UPF0157 family)